MKKFVLFVSALVLFISCSLDECKQDDIKQDDIKYIEIENTGGLYYRYFYLDNHEYIHFETISYYEQVMHSPNCPCNKELKQY